MLLQRGGIDLVPVIVNLEVVFIRYRMEVEMLSVLMFILAKNGVNTQVWSVWKSQDSQANINFVCTATWIGLETW